MFDVFCPHENTRVLLFSRNIERLVNEPAGIAVHYRCHCGHRDVWRTGRPRPRCAYRGDPPPLALPQ